MVLRDRRFREWKERMEEAWKRNERVLERMMGWIFLEAWKIRRRRMEKEMGRILGVRKRSV